MGQRGEDIWFDRASNRDEELLYRRAYALMREQPNMTIARLQIALNIGFYQAERLNNRVRRALLN